MAKLWLALAVLALSIRASAQFVVAPVGEEAGGVTPKALKAEFHAYGAYGTSRLELIFETNPDWADEVDFMMNLPENTEVTGFAYWFKDEYVVAKTVEKQRAAAIYQFITSRRRDPALIEMVGRRQFRVRIAPVDRDKDLRVEIKLAVTAVRGALTLPLKELFHQPLESADFVLTAPTGWKENWGLQGLESDGRVNYEFQSKPWRPREDWRVARPKSTREVSVSRPARSDGTILVSYTATQKLSNVRLQGNGLHSIYPKSVKSMNTGDTVTFAARIKAGVGNSINLRVGPTAWRQSLPRTQFADKRAVVIWGARHLAALKNPDQIRHWGMTLGVPSKETSWLAVPKAEQEQLDRAKLDYAATEFWLLAAKHGHNSKQANAKRKEMLDLVRLRQKDERAVTTEVNGLIQNKYYDAVMVFQDQYGLAVATYGPKSNKALEFSRALDAIARGPRPRWYDDSAQDYRDESVHNAIQNRIYLLLGYQDDWPNSAETDQALTELRRLVKVRGKRGEDDYVNYELRSAIADVERSKVFGHDKDRTEDIRRTRLILPRLVRIFDPSGQMFVDARKEVLGSELNALADGWREKPQPTSTLIGEFDKMIARFKFKPSQVKEPLTHTVANYFQQRRHDPDPRGELLTSDQKAVIDHYKLNTLTVLRSAYDREFEQEVWRWRYLETSPRRDPKDLAATQEKIAAWARTLARPVPTMDFKQFGTARDEFVYYARRYGAEHQLTRKARAAMEKDDQYDKGRVQYRAKVLLTDLEIDQYLWRQLTPEEQRKRDELEKQRNDLFARMGDPLIQVAAPRDAKVTALLPDRQLVQLEWNPVTTKFEYRFDLPPGMKEGQVKIPIWVLNADGSLRNEVFKVQVDQTQPTVEVTFQTNDGGVEVTAVTERQVSRVEIALADGRRLSLSRSEIGGKLRWRVLISGEVKGEFVVIATDLAHNRTEVRRSFSL